MTRFFDSVKTKARAKDWAINLGLMLAAIGAYLLVAEWVLQAGDDEEGASAHRTGPYANIYRKSADPLLEYELRPGAGEVVNDLGYIGPLVDQAKPADVLRVVGLGDSITMYETHEGTNYLTLLGQRARPARGIRTEVLNFAVGGYDTAQEVRALQTKALAYRPDVVVVGYCLNDGFDDFFIFNELTGRISVGAADRSEIEQVRGMGSDGEARGLAIVEFFSKKMRAATASLTPQEFYTAVFEAAAWKESVEALKALGRLKVKHGFEVVVVVFPFLVEFEGYVFAPLQRRVVVEATAAGLDVVDLYDAYRSVGHRKLRKVEGEGRMSDDYVHPNPRGHALAMDALMAWGKERGLVL